MTEPDLICRLRFPVKPIPKGRPRLTTFGGHARAFTPRRTASYETIIRQYLRVFLGSNWILLDEPVRISTLFKIGLPKSTSQKRLLTLKKDPFAEFCDHGPDVDNLQKAIFDAFNGHLWVDDRKVVCSFAAKIPCAPGEDEVIVSVYKLISAHNSENVFLNHVIAELNADQDSLADRPGNGCAAS